MTPSKTSRLLNVLREFLRFLKPRTLYVRSLLILILPLIFVQLVSTWVFFNNHWETVASTLTRGIVGELALVLDAFSSDPSGFDPLQVAYTEHLGIQLTFFPDQIINIDAVGERQIGFFASWLARDLESLRRPFLVDTESFETQVVVQIQLVEGVIQAVIPRQRIFSNTTWAFVFWVIGSALLLFAVTSLFLRSQIRPIVRLADGAQRLGRGETLENDLKYEGAVEIRRAAQAFNAMRANLYKQIRERTDMLSGVSHDLRTPLTRMRLQLSMMGENDDIKDIMGDVLEMEAMIEAYLTFARTEKVEAVTKVNLTQLLQSITEKWQRNDYQLNAHIENTPTLLIRENSFRRAIDNLISNAHRHATTTWITAGKRRNHILIIVDDDGNGIPEAMRDKVFRPFFRVEGSRNKHTGGSGLGLTIARDVIRAHGGAIFLGDSPYGGLRVTISLPA
ncbi:MAG: HAMP domain-containing protein [Alphaproteobacteria bacterium]|nr:HAMP domain-containing protein [Alphaproteobacteria bacterium]